MSQMKVYYRGFEIDEFMDVETFEHWYEFKINGVDYKFMSLIKCEEQIDEFLWGLEFYQIYKNHILRYDIERDLWRYNEIVFGNSLGNLMRRIDLIGSNCILLNTYNFRCDSWIYGESYVRDSGILIEKCDENFRIIDELEALEDEKLDLIEKMSRLIDSLKLFDVEK